MAETTTLPAPVAAQPSFQWGPVIAGALGASAISTVLLAFGSGIGLSAVSAQPYAGASAKALAVISGIYLLVTAVASFAIGGYVAGRLRMPVENNVDERHFRDGAHGFGVWAISVLIGAIVAASGVGGVMKAATQTVGTVAAAGAAGAAANPATGQAVQNISMMPTDYAVDRLFAPGPTPPAAGAPAPNYNAAATRALAASIKSGQLSPRDRTTLAQYVSQQTGLPQADAEKRVDDTYADLKAAEQQARDKADAARKAALIAAFGLAATLLLACAAACGGAAAGANHRDERIVVRAFGTSRFW